jgi:hypothetical protein
MIPDDLLRTAAAAGFILRVHDGKLLVKPADMSDEWRQAFKAHKDALVALILAEEWRAEGPIFEFDKAFRPPLKRPWWETGTI